MCVTSGIGSHQLTCEMALRSLGNHNEGVLALNKIGLGLGDVGNIEGGNISLWVRCQEVEVIL